MVNMENYEEYMLLYADGELKPGEEQALLAFVQQHPELEAELKAYAATRMLPDEDLVFEYKDSLLKTAGPGRSIGLGSWKMYAAAACVLLVAVLFITNRNDREETTNDIAIEETITAPVIPSSPVEAPANDTAAEKNIHSTQPVNTIAVNNKVAAKKEPVVKQEVVTATVKKEPVAVKQEAMVARSNRDTVMQAIAKAPQLTAHTPGAQEKQGEEENMLTPVQTQDEIIPGRKTNRTARFIATVLGDKPQGLEAFENAIDNKLMAVKDFGRELKDTEVKLRFGKKEVTIVRF